MICLICFAMLLAQPQQPVADEDKDFAEGNKAWAQRDLRKALAAFTRSIENKPTWAAYSNRGVIHVILGEYDAGLADLNKSLEMGAAPTLKTERAKAYLGLREYRKAIADCSDVLDRDLTKEPDLAEQARRLRARANRKIRDFEAAEADWAALIALKKDPADRIPLLCERANLRVVANQLDRALEDCNRALDMSRESTLAYETRCHVYQAMGEFDKVLADRLEVLRLEPEEPNPYNNLAWLWSTCPDDRFRQGKKAVEFAKKACEMTNWKNPAYVDTLSAAYAEMGDFERAIEYEKKAMESEEFLADYKDEIEERLAGYRMGKAWRETKLSDP